MKLVGFSPWQHTATSISNPSDKACIVHNIVGRPSNFASSSKRARSSKTSSVSDVQADLILTTDHQISILGHTTSKKILKGNSSNNNKSKELPQWIYTSMPGERSSLLAKKSGCEKVGAVVDPNSRSVFSVQKDNTIIKIWSLDDEVTGPDDTTEEHRVEKIDLPSCVVTMDAIPYRHQSHVKIKGHDQTTNVSDKTQGGVVGLLSNGQTFVVLITALKEVRVGYFGKINGVSSKSKRKSASNGTKTGLAQKHLFSIVGFSSGNRNNEGNETGPKRKLDCLEGSSNTASPGEITLTTMALDAKKHDAIVFTKHVIELSSFVERGKSDENVKSPHKEISAKYSKESGDLNLPHKLNMKASRSSNGASDSKKIVLMTQLDPTHAGLVYQTASKEWFATILDVRFGECITQPFPIILKSSGSSVLQIGGLSTSILAVLTSDDYLAVYDVRRAAILRDVKVQEALNLESEGDFELSIASHWFTGTLGIIRKSCGKGNKKRAGYVKASFAKVGIFDTSSDLMNSEIVSKPLLKGSYNLARAIASSMTTIASIDRGNIGAEVSPLEQNMMEWIPTTKNSSSVDHNQVLLSSFYEKVESLTPDSTEASLGSIYSEAAEAFAEELGGNIQLTNGSKAKDTHSDTGSHGIPQRFIDLSVATAVDTILSAKVGVDQVVDAAEVLMKCMKTEKFSGRNHFDRSSKRTSKDILRSVLFATKKRYSAQSSGKEDITISPLNLIYHMLHYCSDAIPEHMLISMVNFVLCHISADEFKDHWTQMSKNDIWYSDPTINVLEKRLKEAMSQIKEKGSSEELEDLIKSLDKRLVISQQLFYIERIVTHSKCNSALLRSSMREGLSKSDTGEVGVLTQVLTKLLRNSGKEKKSRGSTSVNSSACICQWLSALIDSNLGIFLQSSGSNKSLTSIECAKKDVAATIQQTKALIGLEELIDHVDTSMNDNDSKNPKKTLDVGPIAPYVNESLIF